MPSGFQYSGKLFIIVVSLVEYIIYYFIPYITSVQTHTVDEIVRILSFFTCTLVKLQYMI